MNLRDEYKKQFIVTGIKPLHMVLSLALFFVLWLLFRYGQLAIVNNETYRYDFFIGIRYGIVLFLFNRTYNSYLLGYSRVRDLVFAQQFSQLFSAAVIYVLVLIAWNSNS